MGLYDSIYLDVTCPGCGEESAMECQTKALSCEMNEYRKGDFVLGGKVLTEMTETSKIHCIAECGSEKCNGKFKGLGGLEDSKKTFIYLHVVLRGGSVTGEYIILGEA